MRTVYSRPIFLFLLLALTQFLVAQPAALAQGWKDYTLRSAQFQIPANWPVKDHYREREYTFASPDGMFDVRIAWWFPDEPLLGYADIVSHEKLQLAGQSALLIRSQFSNTHHVGLAFLKKDEEGEQLLMQIDSKKVGLEALEAELFRLAERAVLFGIPVGSQRQSAAQTPRSDARPLKATGATEAGHYNVGGDFSVPVPSGWSAQDGEHSGIQDLILISPNRDAMVLVARARGDRARPASAALDEYLGYLYRDSFQVKSIEGESYPVIAGETRHALETVAKLFDIYGLQLPYKNGYLTIYQGGNAQDALLLITIRNAQGAQALKAPLQQIATSLHYGPLRGAFSTPITIAGQQGPADEIVIANPIGLDAMPGTAWLAQLQQRFGSACTLERPEAWNHPTRSVMEQAEVDLRFVALCENGGHTIFGVAFKYDMRGQTSNYFHPLYINMMKANNAQPYSFLEVRDAVMASLRRNSNNQIALSHAELELPAQEPSVIIEENSGGGTSGSSTAASNTVQPRSPILFDAQHVDGWQRLESDGGSFDENASLGAHGLFVEIAKNKGWAAVGLRSTQPVITMPARGATQSVTLSIKTTLEKTGSLFLAFTPVEKQDQDIWKRHDIRLMLYGTEKGLRWQLEGNALKKKQGHLPVKEGEGGVSILFHPDQSFEVRVGRNVQIFRHAFEHDFASRKWHLEAYSRGPGKNWPATLKLLEIVSQPQNFEATADPVFWQAGAHSETLFDGTALDLIWDRLQLREGYFDTYARLGPDGLQIAWKPEDRADYIGLYSPGPLLWLDNFRRGAKARVSLTLDGDQTDSFDFSLHQYHSLSGNRSGNQAYAMSWHKQEDGTYTFLSRIRAREKDGIRVDGLARIPDKIDLVLTPQGVAVEAEGVPSFPLHYPQLSDHAGLRYRLAAIKNATGGGKLVLKRIEQSYEPATPNLPAKPEAGVAPLEEMVLFDRQVDEAWLMQKIGSQDPANYSRQSASGLSLWRDPEPPNGNRVFVASKDRLIKLDDRLNRTPYELTAQFDPNEEEFAVILAFSATNTNFWNKASHLVNLRKISAGRYRGDFEMTLFSDHFSYGIWTRIIPGEWIRENWDGRVTVRFDHGQINVGLSQDIRIAATSGRARKGYSHHVVVAPGSPYHRSPGRGTLVNLSGRWLTPEGMGAVERWTLVNDEDFDADAFLADVAKDMQQERPDPLVELIDAPTLSPSRLPPPTIKPQSGLWNRFDIWHWLNPVSTAHAAPNCDKQIDDHVGDMRRVSITLAAEPDLTKAFVKLGTDLFGAAQFKEGGWAKAAQARFGQLMTAYADGTAIGDSLKKGNDKIAVGQIMHALLNIGLSSSNLEEMRQFRQGLNKRAKADMSKALQKLSNKDAEKLIVETAKQFQQSNRLQQILKEFREKGSKMDVGTIFGKAVGHPTDLRANVSAYMWTFTNNTLSIFSPHYVAAKALADAMHTSAQAAKAFVVNDRVRDMYTIWKEEVQENSGTGAQDFYNARTIRGDRIVLTEIKDLMRSNSNDYIDDKIAQKKLFDLYAKWYKAEQAAAKKSDRFSGLKNRFKNLDCRYDLFKATWPNSRTGTAAVSRAIKDAKSWSDTFSKGWDTLFDDCAPTLELLKKYGEIEADVRKQYLKFMKKGNKCDRPQWIDANIDSLVCSYLQSGAKAYRKSMANKLNYCGLIDKQVLFGDNLIVNATKELNHSKQIKLLDSLKIEAPRSLFDCICKRSNWASSSARGYYHPETIGDFDPRYSCNHPGEPCVVSGFGCTRHPFKTDPDIWEGCIAKHKIGMSKDKDGKPDPTSGERLDDQIRRYLKKLR